MVETSISDLLCERASLQPNDTAFTFIDYERDWNGVAETLTWSQLYRRTVNAARALQHCGATGDRAVIMARRVSTTSWRSLARCTRDRSRFRWRCRWGRQRRARRLGAA